MRASRGGLRAVGIIVLSLSALKATTCAAGTTPAIIAIPVGTSTNTPTSETAGLVLDQNNFAKARVNATTSVVGRGLSTNSPGGPGGTNRSSLH